MFKVTTEWHQQRNVQGKASQKKLRSETDEFDWPDAVARYVGEFLEENPKIVFSGMEEFGAGECVLNPISLRCRVYGDCRAHHIESAREYVESTVGELKPGESTDLTGGALKWVSITIEALPDSDPEEDLDSAPDPEEELEGEPAEPNEPDAPKPAEPETYVRRSAFHSEVRPVGEPITHAEDSPETLAERRELVRVRPHFKVPDGRSSLRTVRSPWCYEARVVRESCGDMVLVKYTWETEDAPWTPTGAFKVSELHKVHECECAGCCGKDGITEFEGA